MLPPAPPAAPRALPGEVPWRLLFSRNPVAILGFVFAFPLACTLCFPLVGLPLFAAGLLVGARKLLVLRSGAAARATVVSVELDESLTVQDMHPWRIRYVFDGGEGAWRTWDVRAALLGPGDELWIVHRGRQSAPWPPMT